jgi:hypothetical protein
MSNHEITFTEAQQMTSAYQNDPRFLGQTVSCVIPKDIIYEIFANPDAANLKIYFAKNIENELTIVMLGADAGNNDFTKIIMNNVSKCPNYCHGNLL